MRLEEVRSSTGDILIIGGGIRLVAVNAAGDEYQRLISVVEKARPWWPGQQRPEHQLRPAMTREVDQHT
jgi:hypothetical protein